MCTAVGEMECQVSRKLCYRKRGQAYQVVLSILGRGKNGARKGGRKAYRGIRVYECPFCRMWHVGRLWCGRKAAVD